jgi:hypothetical protein
MPVIIGLPSSNIMDDHAAIESDGFMASGVLLVGVYGSGKTSVCEEMAETMESAGMAYGAIDLDWLGWYDAPGGGDGHGFGDPVALANLACMVANYLAAGVECFVLAGTVWADAALAAIRSVMPFPLRVVHLTVPYAEIEARLSTAPTSGRAQDLQEARRQLDELGFDFADVVVANDRPVREVADDIVDWLGWR